MLSVNIPQRRRVSTNFQSPPSHQHVPNYEGGKLVRGGRRKNGKRKTNGRRNDVQPFIRKIYQIINDEKIQSIYWTESGDSFVINKDLFQVRY